MNTSAPRILIVDDHPLVREGIAARLERHLSAEICGEAATVPEAVQLVDSTSPDLAIVDIALPSGDGIDLIKRIGMRAPGVKTLVSSMYDEFVYAERALKAGARGYVSKRDAPERIVEATAAVLEGRIWLSEAMTERVLGQVAKPAGAGPHSSIASLSDRELEIFRLLGEGSTPREIATARNLSIKTVEAHREHIKTKLGVTSSAKLLHHAIEWRLSQDTREAS